MNKKTRRFLFYTGGTDSTLILRLLLELASKNKNDEIVLVLAQSETLRSGQEDRTHKAMGSIISKLIEPSNSPAMRAALKRVSVLVIGSKFITNPKDGALNCNAVDHEGKEHQVDLPITQVNQEMRSLIKTLSLQELTLLGLSPQFTGFWGSCTNKFYIGICGSDLAARSIDKLLKIWNLNLEVMLDATSQNDLDGELKKAKCESYGRTGGKYFPKEWLPSLHFPLAGLKKVDVITMLKHYKIDDYQIDKPEHLLEYYSNSGMFELTCFTAVYDEFAKQFGNHEGFPSLVDFIRNPEIKVTVNGEQVVIDEAKIKESIEAAQLGMMGRAMGMGSLPDELIKEVMSNMR